MTRADRLRDEIKEYGECVRDDCRDTARRVSDACLAILAEAEKERDELAAEVERMRVEVEVEQHRTSMATAPTSTYYEMMIRNCARFLRTKQERLAQGDDMAVGVGWDILLASVDVFVMSTVLAIATARLPEDVANDIIRVKL